MRMIIPGNQTGFIKQMLDGRRAALITCDKSELEKPNKGFRGFIYFNPHLLQVIGPASDKSGICHFIMLEINSLFDTHCEAFMKHPEYKIEPLSNEQLASYLEDKKVFFETDYVESGGNVERRINKALQRDVFQLRNEEEFYLYDEYCDVKVFLRPTSDTTENTGWMRPSDIRNLDINRELLKIFTDAKKVVTDDSVNPEENIIIEYSSSSEKISAQYYLTKFHSNHNWNLDPVCIFNIRMSAFVLSGDHDSGVMADMPMNKEAWDYCNGTQYLIDSIHFNSDICFDLDEFKDLMEKVFFDIWYA